MSAALQSSEMRGSFAVVTDLAARTLSIVSSLLCAARFSPHPFQKRSGNIHRPCYFREGPAGILRLFPARKMQ